MPDGALGCQPAREHRAERFDVFRQQSYVSMADESCKAGQGGVIQARRSLRELDPIAVTHVGLPAPGIQ